MAQAQVKDVTVVGGGTAGWMAAASLAKFLGPSVNITLVESDAIGIVGVGEATIPQIKHLNRALAINEADFIRGTNGSFKLGIEFANWRKKGEAYLHNFGNIGMGLQSIHFHHYWLRARAEGAGVGLWDHCLNTQAARAMKFAPMDKVGQTRLSPIAYAYHFDATLYGQFLRKYAERHGVSRIEGRITEVQQDAQSGNVTGLKLEDGRTVAGQFFIDCSGFRSLLLGQTLGSGFEDFSHWLMADRAWAVPCENTGPIRPYTQAIAHDAGWQWHIPLQHRTGNGHVFSSQFTTEQAALDTLLSNLEGKPSAEPRLIKFQTGRRSNFWEKNVLALGLASGFLEPLESTSIHLVQSGISRLIPLFPDANFSPATRDEYNRQMCLEFDTIRDFLILHYHATERDDSEFWNTCRTMQIPDRLAHVMELFRAGGRIYHEQEDLFTDSSWLQVMVGQGIMPESYHPIADQLETDKLAGFLSDIRKIVGQAAARLPSHSDYLASIGAAQAA